MAKLLVPECGMKGSRGRGKKKLGTDWRVTASVRSGRFGG